MGEGIQLSRTKDVENFPSSAKVFAQGNNKTPCSDNKVVREGCLVKTCVAGTVEESLADECVELIEKQVEQILEKQLSDKGIDCSTDNEALADNTALTEPAKYKIPGIILAGGSWQNSVTLIKPDSKEVCKLPDSPDYFDWASMDLVDGTPIMCGSWFGSPGKARMKNETEKRQFFAVKSCAQLSPASKEAEWTLYTDDIPYKRDHVSLATEEGILLMGGYNKRSVDLLKPDGSIQSSIFDMKRMIDRGCGIEDEGTLIITGGGSNGRSDSVATKIVDRYNRQGWVENLPEMNEARTAHGCGYYHKNGKKVLVVGGGYYGRYQNIYSTETLTLGSDAWTKAATVPMQSLKRSYGFASVSLNNKVYFIAGDGKRRAASALVFEFDGENWEETQKVEIIFLDDRYQGQKAVAVDLATSGFDEFCKNSKETCTSSLSESFGFGNC